MDANSSTSSLGKLLPKAIVSKRRRRKEKLAQDSDDDLHGRRLSHRTSSLESDDANSSNLTGDDGDRDDRSLGSRASSLAPDTDSLRGRPPAPSAHPSLIGYLTTSSPMVQATHVDSHTRIQSPLSESSQPDRPVAVSSDPDTPSRSVAEPPPVASPSSPSKRTKLPFQGSPARPPQTPPTLDTRAPAIVNTPPTPTDSPHSRAGNTASGSPIRSNGSPSSVQSMSAHRRVKSDAAALGPSKLSSITVAPPSPAFDNEPTPTPSGGPGAGFFSSMISAAQNAANSISNNIQNTSINIGGNKGRATPSKGPAAVPASQVEVEPAPEAKMGSNGDEKESAVRTLGSGDLSLSHLGLDEPASALASPATLKFPDVIDTRARSESAPVDNLGSGGEFLPEESSSRPRSLHEVHASDQLPSQAESSDKSGLQRAASIKSAIKPHRKRGSSVATAATGLTMAPGVTTTNSASQVPGAPKLTGFAIASKKRNRDFHSFFKSVPDDDYLIEDYSCALQREILAHGRLYVSEGHLCFSSNILGWTTTLVMSFDEIVSVEKRSTALVFKNGLMISTLHAKHIFASFTSRDATYDLIVNIWKLGHPTLKSTLNGVSLEGTGGDKTEKVDADPSGPETETQAGSETEDDSADSEDDEEYYDEENDAVPETQATDLTGLDGEADKITARKASAMTLNGMPGDQAKDGASGAGAAANFPGPVAHAPTDCGDSATHYDRIVGDDIIAAPLGQVYDLLFGPTSVGWMAKWLTADQKCTEFGMEDKKGLSLDNRTRNYTYIKPLYAPIGPKQTKCIVTETVEAIDFEKAANFTVSTQTPDVPSGNVFSTKTKYCLSWAENNATRVQVNCTIEWTGKSWLKGPIEKGATDGQTQYCKDLFAAVRSSVSSRSRAGTGTNVASKTKKKGRKGKAPQSQVGETQGNVKSNDSVQRSWGVLEPARGLLKPLGDVLQPVLSGNIVYGLVLGLVLSSWLGFGIFPRTDSASLSGKGHIYRGDRLMAYEQAWMREESELWDWLEERVGLDHLRTDSPRHRKKPIERRALEDRIAGGRMQEREVEEAIRVTEEKLRVLKDVVGKRGLKGASPVSDRIPENVVREEL
ncbi:membrane protein [Paramyrothecium foliicola]|nr:membrane protein [Paramyrothecium foliicola]